MTDEDQLLRDDQARQAEIAKPGMSQWEKSVRLYLGANKFGSREPLGSRFGPRIGVVVLPHKLFMPGDRVLVELGNGSNNRQQVWGVSSKGRAVVAYYMRYTAPYAFATYDAGPLRIPELPGDLVGKPLDGPEARLFAESLRADVAAWRIGAGSPPLNARKGEEELVGL